MNRDVRNKRVPSGWGTALVDECKEGAQEKGQHRLWSGDRKGSARPGRLECRRDRTGGEMRSEEVRAPPTHCKGWGRVETRFVRFLESEVTELDDGLDMGKESERGRQQG